MVRRLRLVLLPLVVVCFFLVGCFSGWVPEVYAYTGTITYSSNTITAVGGTAGSPITFNDLYLADVAGGWGVVTKQSSEQFCIAAKLQIGNGTTTYFNDTCKQVKLNYYGAAGQDDILVKNSSTVTLGVLLSGSDKTTKTGCSLLRLANGGGGTYLFYGEYSGVINLFGCSMQALFTATTSQAWIKVLGSSSNLRVYNCVFDAVMLRETNADVYNTVFSNAQRAMFACSGSFDKVTVSGNVWSVFNWYSLSPTIYNAVVKGSTTADIWMYQTTSSGNVYLVNADCGWNILWDATAQTGKVYRQYQFDLNVLNGDITDVVEGANVTLWKNGVKLGSWLTDSSGAVPQQILTYGFYNQTGGNVMYDGSYPFVMNVTHADWADYTSRFYITEKTHMIISMQNKTVIDSDVYLTADEGVSLAFVFGVVGSIIAVVLAVVFVRRSG